jgi:hypothetical protein
MSIGAGGGRPAALEALEVEHIAELEEALPGGDVDCGGQQRYERRANGARGRRLDR